MIIPTWSDDDSEGSKKCEDSFNDFVALATRTEGCLLPTFSQGISTSVPRGIPKKASMNDERRSDEEITR